MVAVLKPHPNTGLSRHSSTPIRRRSHHTKWAVVSATPRRTSLFLDAMNM
jgi:hypothetical protein